MKRLLLASILVLTSAFMGIAQTPSAQDQGRNTEITTAQIPSAQTKGQITEITLERTTCFGTCPAYTVTLRSDGTITYEGRRFVEMTGTYQGQVYGFARLAHLILSEGYFNLKDNYSARVTDMPSAITSVVMNGKRKTIMNYGDAGPVELWGIEMAIDGMLKSARLEKVKTQSVSRRK
jgi:hypothetical protein